MFTMRKKIKNGKEMNKIGKEYYKNPSTLKTFDKENEVSYCFTCGKLKHIFGVEKHKTNNTIIKTEGICETCNEYLCRVDYID